MIFLDNSKCAEYIKSKDWSSHPMGNPKYWPDELKLQLAMVFRSAQPYLVYWGEKGFTFFNDTFLPLLGQDENLHRLGLPGQEMWGSVWTEYLEKEYFDIREGGSGVVKTKQFIPIPRDGEIQESYWTYSFSPIFVLDGSTPGVLVSVLETTEEVKNEQKLVGVLEGSQDLIAAVDKDARYILLNEAHADVARKIFGVIPYVGMSAYDLLEGKPVERKAVEAVWERALAGESFTIVQNFVYKDGTEKVFRFSYSPIFDSSGNLMGSTQVASDITEALEKEKALLMSQSIFGALSEAMPQIVWAANELGENEFVNEKWSEYTGLSSEEALGKKFYQAFHPDDAESINKAFWKSMEEDTELSHECRIKGKDGVYRWFLIRALPYETESLSKRWVGTCTDINEFKLLADRLRKSEDMLQVTLQSSGVGLWNYDLESGELYLSDTLMKTWGIDKEKYNGTLEECIELIHPKDRKKVREEIEFSIENDTKYDIEYRVIHPRKKIRWISAKGRVYRGDSPTDKHLMGTAIDITQKKRTLLKLQKARRMAESANELKSSFLANISHEIRTPLGVIAGFTDLLSNEEISAAEKKQYSEIIKKTTTQITEIINDVLDLSKVEAGEFKIHHTRFVWKDLLDDVHRAFSKKAYDKRLDIAIDIELDVGETFVSDPIRVKQILFNLVGNAIKFSEKGTITIALRRLSYGVILFVHDEGMGIPKNKQDLLFKPFSQADESITRTFGGTGLGLALSKKMAHLLGGDLTLEQSVEGVGSIFALELTENIEFADTPLEPMKSEQLDGLAKSISGLRVLLVEDAKENQQLFSIQLGAKGVDVDIATNGLEGIEKALTNTYDLVLMDIQMPVLDGFSATSRLRELGYDKPIIALTAHAMSEVREKCLGVGCDDYATKPLDINILESKIRSVVWN